MTRRKLATAGVIAALGLSTSACASDPAFWEGMAIGLDTAALALALSDPCYGAYACVYVQGRDHRTHRDRDHAGRDHGRRDQQGRDRHRTGGHDRTHSPAHDAAPRPGTKP